MNFCLFGRSSFFSYRHIFFFAAVDHEIHYRTGQDDERHGIIETSISYEWDKLAENIRSDAETEVQAYEESRCGQTDVLPLGKLDAERLNDGLEVAVAEADQRTGKEQHPAGRCVAQDKVGKEIDHQGRVDDDVRPFQIHEPSCERPCQQHHDRIDQEEITCRSTESTFFCKQRDE